MVSARAEPVADNDRARAAIVQTEQQRTFDRARERCRANRGTDCDTVAGLQEWLLQDRSRAEAVLDRVAPLGSSSAGASVPPVPSGSSAGGGSTLSPRYP